MKKILVPLVAVVLLVGAGYSGLRYYRGDSGATSGYGGRLEAKTMPDFATTDAGRWNGTPTSLAEHRGHPVLVEAWSPG